MKVINNNGDISLSELKKVREEFFTPAIMLSKEDAIRKLHVYAENTSILCVDDESAVRNKLRSGLLKFPFARMDFAENGRVALELFKRNTYNIVLTDFDMPEMDGMTLSNKIFELKPDAIVMVLSSYTVEDFVQRVRARSPWMNLTASPKLKSIRIVKKSSVDNEFWSRLSRSCGFAVMNDVFVNLQVALVPEKK